MGIWDRFFGPRAETSSADPPHEPARASVVGAASDSDGQQAIKTFDDKNITFSGDLTEYDYDAIQRDKQTNIYRLYELSDYYIDKDPIYSGIIKGVYTPFSMVDRWRLVGANEATKKKYEEYYERIHLADRMESIMLQYFKYANVYVYLMEDGNLITLPVHKIRVGNIMVNGEPVLEFDARGVRDDLKQKAQPAKQEYMKDEELKVRLDGYPPEVAKALMSQNPSDWVQLNPENTFVLQGIKEDWARYAIPMVSSALTALAKKALITQYEASLLNLGMRAFVHVNYGDTKEDMLPDINQLSAVRGLFRQGMTGSAQVVTNQLAKATIIQPKTDELFQFDKYKDVNSEILSAGGISGIIVSGSADDGSTFASAQISMQAAAMRIQRAKDNFAEMMNRINRRLNNGRIGVTHSSPDKIPKFTFPPTDLAGNSKFLDVCFKLWSNGVLSNETMLQIHGYDVVQEIERMKVEEAQGFDHPLMPSTQTPATRGNSGGGTPGEETKMGRPELEDDERSSDKGKAQSGRQPKPSNPDGSQ